MARGFRNSRGAYGADLEMIEQINAFQNTNELEDNLNKVRKLLNEFYTNELNDFTRAIQNQLNRTPNNIVNNGNFTPKGTSGMPLSPSDAQVIRETGQQATEEYAKGAAEGLKGGNGKGVNWAAIGKEIGANLANSILQTVGSMVKSWSKNTYGELDLTGSFAKGTSLFAQLRSELGSLTFGQNTLKDFSKSIENAYRKISEDGLVVSPTMIYAIYSRLGDLVSVSGSSNARLTSLLTTITEMNEAGGGKFDTSSYAMQRLTAVYGEAFAKDVQAMFNISASQFDNSQLTADVLNTLMNSKQIESLITYAQNAGKDQEWVRKRVEDLAQTYAFLGGSGLTSTSITDINKIMDTIATATEKEIAGIFSNNSGLGALLTANGLNARELLTQEGFASNAPKILETLVKSLSDYSVTGGNSVTNAELSRKVLQQAFGVDVSNPQVLAELQSSKINWSQLSEYVNSDISTKQINSYYQSQAESNPLTQKLNNELELIGLQLSDDTYESQMLGWATVIGNKLTDLVGTSAGSGILSAIMNTASTSIIAGVMKGSGAGAAGAGISGSGGLMKALSAAGPYALIAAAIVAAVLGTNAAIKDYNQKEHKQLKETYDIIEDTYGEVFSINGKIVDENGEETEADYSDENYYTGIETEFDDRGGVKTKLVKIDAQDKEAIKEHQEKEAQKIRAAYKNAFQEETLFQGVSDTSNELPGRTGVVARNFGILKTKTGEENGLPVYKYTYTDVEGNIQKLNLPSNFDLANATRSEIKQMAPEAYKAFLYSDDVAKLVLDTDYLNKLRFDDAYRNIESFRQMVDFYKAIGFIDYGPSTGGWNDSLALIYEHPDIVYGNLQKGELTSHGWFGTILTSDYGNFYTKQEMQDNDIYKRIKSLYGPEITDDFTQNFDLEGFNKIKNANLYKYANFLNLDELNLSRGLDNIPYDAYPALLHRGEMVIPASRANYIRVLFGQKPVTPSTYAENINTKYNGFVQSIPQYSAGIDAVRFAVSNLGAPYEGNGTPGSRRRSVAKGDSYNAFDCSSLVSRSYGALDEPGSVSPTIIPLTNTEGMYNNLTKWGFTKLFDAGSSSSYGNEDDLKRIGIITGDILLYGNGKKGRPLGINHVAIAENGTSQIHANVKVRRDRLHPYSKPHLAAVFRYAGGDTSVVGGLPTVGVPVSTETSYGYNTPIGTVGMTPRVIPDAIRRLMGVKNPIVQSMLRRLGYDTSVAENSDTPTTSSNTINYALASLRNNLWNTAGEIDRLMFFNRTLREVGGQTDPAAQAWMETVMNRAASRSKTLRQVVTGAYYGKNNDSGLTNALSDKNKLRLDTALALVLAGSNITKYATGNASGNAGFGYGNGREDPYTLMVDGERFGIEKGDKNWWVKLGIAALASGGIISATPGGIPAILGEGKHDEAVIPLNDNKDYLGIEEIGVNIIDALDIISNKLCERLDTLISLKQREMSENASAKSLPTKQRSARTEALISFQGIY